MYHNRPHLSNGLIYEKDGNTGIRPPDHRSVEDCNTRCAQGGIACVTDIEDSFEEHLQDTLTAGARLCNREAALAIIEAGPAAVRELIEIGTRFTTRGELGYEKDSETYDLAREGGHHFDGDYKALNDLIVARADAVRALT